MLTEIFSRCVAVGDCVVWTGAHNGRGYGLIHNKSIGKTRYVHRIVAESLGYKIKGLYVCHHCDNPSCCRPDHLFVGSPTDNSRDAMRKGRWVAPPVTNWPSIMKKQKHHWQKLSPHQVISIRKRLAAGENQESIGKRFGVSSKTISKINTGIRWAHLK